ncbi:Thiol-disulfide oxidoreductase ResA [Gimesia maris]|uniref:Thiol-disulfide oxidoreductase ResA n=2 Tax=Gimesia maris TaxID=122 RepID=A0ABX5YTA4_9PLAN|nr:Thiol-disulfide oxidoreductase ResA [Gimesia maris]QGQ28109.1 TlpA family protein disulfide reductase [Gimesia maris]
MVLFMIRKLILCSTLLCLLTACSFGESQEQETEAQPLTAREAVIQSLPAVEIQLKEITPETLPAEIEKHRGKVVFVDYWATWCPMCLDSFHHLSRWHQEYADKGLVILAINLDEDNESNRKVVKEYLTEQRAPFENFISTVKPDAIRDEKFGIEGSTLPFCQIYNREGELAVTLGNVNPERLYGEVSISDALTKLFTETDSAKNANR